MTITNAKLLYESRQARIEHPDGTFDKQGHRMTDKYIVGAQLDAQIAIASACGESLDRFPRFHAPNIPTLRGAIELAAGTGIEITRRQIDICRRRDGHTQTCAIVWVTGTPIASAALSTDPVWGPAVAEGLAFRNAVQRVLFPRSRVWTQKPDDFSKEEYVGYMWADDYHEACGDR